MKWLNKLLRTESKSTPLQPIIQSGNEMELVDVKKYLGLGEGKHIIHIMINQKEVTLSFNEEEFKNGLLRGELLNQVPREEEP